MSKIALLVWSLGLKLKITLPLCLYKALQKTVPIYISDELNLYEPKRPLRSSYAGPLYTVSVGRKEVSDFDFAIKGPRLWNSLPMDLRQAPSVMTFKKRHTYSKDTIISRDWKHKRFDWLQNQKGAI